MKNIIFFIPTLNDGGAERVVSILANYFSKKSNNIEILLYYDNIFYTISNNVKITVVTNQTQTNNLLVNLLWIRKYFKTNAKIVISFMEKFNILAVVATRCTGIPIIVSDRSDPNSVRSAALKILRDFSYWISDCLVVQTESSKQCFPQAIQKKAKVIYNPIDIAEIKKIKNTNIKKNEKEIVSVGRLIASKNHKMMIKGFKKFHDMHPDYNLVIYGEGPERHVLRELIEKLNLENCVQMPGKVSDVFNHVSSAGMFVFTSNYEGMPNAVIEAMVLGVPVISTKVFGARDIIQNEYNGLLIDVGNEEQFVKALNIYALNPSLKCKCGENGEKIEKEVNPNKIIQQWEKIISSLAKEKY